MLSKIPRNILANGYDIVASLWPQIPYAFPGRLPANLFKPFRYLFNITNRCNLSCFYCCQQESMAQNRAELSHAEIVSIANKLPRHAVIILCGGEPLIREDILEILQDLTTLKKKMAIITNGLLLSEKIIDSLIQNKILNIGVSVDGLQDYYEKVKGHGTYAVLMENIALLKVRKQQQQSVLPYFDWKVTVFPENLKELPALYAQAIDYGANTFTVSLPKQTNMQFSDCLGGLALLDIVPEIRVQFSREIIPVFAELQRMSKSAKTKLRIYPFIKHARDLENLFLNSPMRERYASCKEPWSGMVISAIGEVYPCLSVRLGDLKAQSLSQILTSAPNMQFRSNLKRAGIFPVCEGCCYARRTAIVSPKGGVFA